jgi:arylsulfatase A-like enzyme
MSRRRLVQAVSAIVVALTSIHLLQLEGYATTSDESPRRPNIVLIMADDLGYGDLDCFHGWIETSHLRQLAVGGTRFTDFHSSGNVCSPTRAGLMTGRYQQRAGIPGVVFADPTRPAHYHGLQTSEVTFAELLSDAGYATAAFGKWHLGYYTKYNPIHHGFDEFRGYVSGNIDFFSHVDQAGKYDWWHQDEQTKEEGYTTHLITKHAVRFIEANKDRPFCLYLPHEAPHYPYQGPDDKPLRTVDGKFNNQGARRDIKNAYREMVQEMDKSVGEVIATLKRLDLAENTLVLFFSDNGANKNESNGPLRGAKGSNWEGGHRVPFIASWPGKIAAGTFCDEIAISLDIMPTLLAAANVTVPADNKLDGVNLLPQLLTSKTLGDRQLFWNGKAMREGMWKLIVDGKGGDKLGLYDLVGDLGEKNNLADAEPDRVKSMLAKLDAWKQDVAGGDLLQPREYADEQAKKAKRAITKKKKNTK